MKKLLNVSMRHFVLLLTLLSMGLMSCDEQGEEIIPFQASDTAIDAADTDLTVETATEIIINHDGKIIGFYDEEWNVYDKNGSLIPANARDDMNGIPLISIFEHKNFGGRRLTFYIGSVGTYALDGEDIKINLTDYGYIANVDSYGDGNVDYGKKVSSAVTAPNCEATFYSQYNHTGELFTMGDLDVGVAAYSAQVPHNDKARAITVKFNANLIHSGNIFNHTNLNTLCGYAYNKVNHDRSGDSRTYEALPLYYNTPLLTSQLDHLNWNGKAKSISINKYSKCVSGSPRKGIIVADGDREKIRGANQHKFIQYDSHGNTLGMTVRSIIPDGDYHLSEDQFGLTQEEVLNYLEATQNKLSNANTGLLGLNDPIPSDYQIKRGKEAFCKATERYRNSFASRVVAGVSTTGSFLATITCPGIDLFFNTVDDLIAVTKDQYINEYSGTTAGSIMSSIFATWKVNKAGEPMSKLVESLMGIEEFEGEVMINPACIAGVLFHYAHMTNNIIHFKDCDEMVNSIPNHVFKTRKPR